MAVAYSQNRARIQAILEQNLAIVVPKLYSVGLISEEDRDIAIRAFVDSNTRVAFLSGVLEGKVVNFHDLLVFVYALVSSGIDAAEKGFIKSLVYLPQLVTIVRRLSFGDVGAAKSTSSTHHRRPSDSVLVTSDSETLKPLKILPTDTASQSGRSNEATSASPTTAGATNILGPDSETVIPPEESEVLASSVKNEIDEMSLKNSSVWYKHAQEFPGIKFSNYYTKQAVTYRGDVIKGEGIELQIPGRAIRGGQSVEFTIQGCISGPFELPDDVSLASPVYVITPHYKFQREVTVLMDIFVHLQSYEDCKAVVFLTSPGKPVMDLEGPFWRFNVCETKPQSSTRLNQCVRIEVAEFCLFCLGIRRRGMKHQSTNNYYYDKYCCYPLK